MLVRELMNPESIVVVGGSNDISKPGGRVLKNLLEGKFKGRLHVVNPKETEVQGITCVSDVSQLSETQLAIISIPAKFVPHTIKVLAEEKGTRAFIVLSAGFSELSEEGKKLEKEMVDIVNRVNGSLIGPNCLGVLTPAYHGVFGGQIPRLHPKGCDFVSGSGATACFFLETAIPQGLTFSSIITVGNSAQIGVEDVLKEWDENFDPKTSSNIKLLYMEKIDKPDMLLKHASSLTRKGCRIAAIKAGASEAGSRAASSHTGALASSDNAVDALFRKAGIVRCYSREELVSVAGVFNYKPLEGKNIAIITHAGGPGVMLADALSEGGLTVPPISGPDADELLGFLHPGSSAGNPVDFLATGTAEQLGTIMDYVDKKFDNIDGMVVIFGSPGLFDVTGVYKVLDEKIRTCRKPVYPVLPSTITAKNEVEYFLSLGRVNFPDEVVLGRALAKVSRVSSPVQEKIDRYPVDHEKIRKIIDNASNGYISAVEIRELLDAAGIPRAGEAVTDKEEDAVKHAETVGFPVVMKVVGPLHKTDVGGVVLDIKDCETVKTEFNRLMNIPEATAVLIQPMLSGIELFVGAKSEPRFGHLLLCGLGGVFIEVLKDVSAGLVPIDSEEALSMIRNLKGYGIIRGARGLEGVDENVFADVIVKLSALLESAPEISEMDLNPLLGKGEKITAVDARINVEKFQYSEVS
jgi:acetate---CoA ligase (ADP-forming)